MSRRIIIIGVTLICCIIIMGFSFIINDNNNENNNADKVALPKSNIEEQYYAIKEVNQHVNLFTNFIDGYSILIPDDLKVYMDSAGIRTVLKNDNMQIEIYKEDLKEGVSPETYINYSNKFLENTVDHKKEYEQDLIMAGYNTHVVKWSRNKLSKVENDKNYYASLDMKISNKVVFTFLFKSEKPFYSENQYVDIVSSFYKKTSAGSYEKIADKNILNNNISENKNWNKETKEVYEKYFGEKSTLKWGIFEPSAPEDFTNLKNLENRIQYKFPFLVYYKHFNKDNDVSSLRKGLTNAAKENRILELTLQTTSQEDGNMVYDILNGEYDQFLDLFISEINEAKIPVLMRFCNEMNGDWCMYSSYHTSKDTEIFKQLYKYVYKKFEEKGASKYVIWVWNPNEKSLPDFKWNGEDMYYPGDEYVDVIGLTGYNTGTYYDAEKWRSFDEIYEIPYKKVLENYNKPIMITEFSSSSVGGNKEAWVLDMFDKIKNYDQIKVAIWWSGRDLDSDGSVARPYWIDETEELIDIFRKNLT
ncbi:glycoside hydrolase family 26 protein [Anaerovorax odorimutans]|uniref:glycoside hydrolase family 26 protein n=1 Tax=Anaerovorax odorimutans TaxID=109327 RepID=UPI0004250D9C|nr:glycosyl hydrolase [Anaerovorax odorimutans]